MRKINILVITVVLLIGTTLNAQITDNSNTLKAIGQDNNKSLKVDTIFTKSPVFKGEYFSNNTPDAGPLLFAKGLINPRLHHFHSAPVFSPDINGSPLMKLPPLV